MDDCSGYIRQITEMLIKYLIKLRQFNYIFLTEKENALGIKIINQKYTNDKGYSFSDVE